MLKIVVALILLLSSGTLSAEAERLNVAQPDSIKFGQQLSISEQALDNLCDTMSIREIKPAQIPGVLKRQMQLDCYGFMMAGKKRLAEFVYKDEQLLLVWILVDKQELPEIENAMVEMYGKAKYQSSAFSAFAEHRIALRKDIPEFLFYAPEASAQFEAWFSSAK